MSKIVEEYRRGATVALPALHRTWTPLGRLCEAITREFNHPAHANAYITPGNAAGFTPHYDVHEVFVLQVAGSKRWSIFAPITPLPHRSQLFRPELFAGQAPIDEVELTAGDLLYLPRGFLHSTTTADSCSAHVTVGITVYTWADLVKDFLQTAIGIEDLRKALPAGFAADPELAPVLRRGMIEVLDRLRRECDPDALLESFTARVRAAQPPRPPPFRADVRLLDLESTLRAMVELDTFRVSGLPDHLPPEGNLGLSRHLVDIGFLTAGAAHAV